MVDNLIRGFNSLFYLESNLEVVYKASRFSISLDSSKSAECFFRKRWNKELMNQQEQVYVIFVDRKYRPIEWLCLHTGGTSDTTVDIKLLIKYISKYDASGIFLAHNHPSGSIEPSENDREVTRKLVRVCEMIQVEFIDHLILTEKDYFSFKEDELI